MESNSVLVHYIALVLVVILVVSFWRIFTKAGKAGWKSLFPVYNIYVLLKIIGRPGWWTILYFIPVVNIGISIIVALDLARSFGKSNSFGFFGLWLFDWIGWPILGFGNSKYIGPSGKNRKTDPEHKWAITLIAVPFLTIAVLVIIGSIILTAINPERLLKESQCTQQCSKILNISDKQVCINNCNNTLK